MRPLLTVAVLILGMIPAAFSCGRSSTEPVQTTAGQLSLTEAVTEIEQLATPAGADQQDFDALKFEIASLLKARGEERFVSAAPTGSYGHVNDLNFSPGTDGGLVWTYVNRGDYDLNSEVNGADIAPIAAHFLSTASDQHWVSRGVVADGDSNGEVNAADIVAIAGNFLSAVEGYQVEASANGETGWTLVETVLFSSSVATDTRRTFSLQLDAPVHGTWYRVAPFHRETPGTPSNAAQYAARPPQLISITPVIGKAGSTIAVSAQVSGTAPFTYTWSFGAAATPAESIAAAPSLTLSDSPGEYQASLTVANPAGSDSMSFVVMVTSSEAPLARFTATPQFGEPGSPVELDASTSVDPDGTIVRYEWDLNGDGSFEIDGGGQPFRNTNLPPQVGELLIGLKVTDDVGDSGTMHLIIGSTAPLPAPTDWNTSQTIDPNGSGPSLAVVNGKPAISYRTYFEGPGSEQWGPGHKLAYATTGSTTGTSGWSKQIVDDPPEGHNPETATWSALHEVDGRPAIAYRRYPSRLIYAANSLPDGSGEWSFVDTGGENSTNKTGNFMFLQAHGDSTWIGHVWGQGAGIRLRANSLADWQVYFIDTDSSYIGFDIIGGMPAVSYRITSEGLKYSSASEPSGQGNWNVYNVESGMTGSLPSLAEVNGNPAIAYYHQDVGLKYAYCNSTTGDGEWTVVLLEEGQYYSSIQLKVINGLPGVVYHRSGSVPRGLKYAHTSRPDGSGGWTNGFVLPDASADVSPSLVEVAGRAAVAYRGSGGLRYAILSP